MAWTFHVGNRPVLGAQHYLDKGLTAAFSQLAVQHGLPGVLRLESVFVWFNRNREGGEFFSRLKANPDPAAMCVVWLFD
jgi:hypothetical protein